MQYSKKVLQHFMKPHNQGKMKSPSAVGMVGNPKCGDIMRLYIKVAKDRKRGEYLKDIKFETLGCASAIATSSMVTDLAMGKTLEEALKITRQNVAESLDGLPANKMHCSNLAADALHKAIQEYQQK